MRYESTTHPLARRKKILDARSTSLVLDVGANIGHYGKQMSEIGYKKIVSFEPLKFARYQLRENAKKDIISKIMILHWPIKKSRP